MFPVNMAAPIMQYLVMSMVSQNMKHFLGE
jgi:hypothetical protein